MIGIRVQCHLVMPDAENKVVGVVWQNGVVWSIQLPGGPYELSEATLGPQWVEYSSTYDDGDEAVDEYAPSWALEVEKRGKVWEVNGDAPHLTLRCAHEIKRNWFCDWSLKDGELTIHSLNKEALATVATTPFPRWQGGFVPLPRWSGGLASMGIIMPDNFVPTLEFAHVGDSGIISILTSQVVATVVIPPAEGKA